MRVLTILALITFFCTCGRAQIVVGERLKYTPTSVAFIKQASGSIVDSITIRTSMDSTPYGFAFLADTLLMDVEVVLSVDELTIETFARGHSFGQQRCWVDPPSADVYLSIKSGKGRIDSVGLSPVDAWYRKVAGEMAEMKGLAPRKNALGLLIARMNEDLVVTRFIEAYLNLPNFTATDAFFLRQIMDERFAPVRKHPEFQRLLRRTTLLATHKPGWLKRLAFRDPAGRLRQLPKPKTDFFVLEIYRREDPVCQENHEVLKSSSVVDSLLAEVPMISLTYADSPALWRLYVKDGDFTWPHGRQEPDPKNPVLQEWMISPHSTYLLIDDRFKLVGIYPDVQGMVAGVWWHTQQ